MAVMETSGSNPDVGLLYDINGLAEGAPSWLDRVMGFVGEYGLLLAMVLLVLWCWWSGRRRAGSLEAAAASAAAVVWAPLAAALAVLVNIPIRGFVARPRPFLDHQGLDVLVHGKTDYSFVSDHATLAMAMAAALFVVRRRYGLIGIGLALAEGFCRIFMGVHYPTDVIGGFALGTAVALLLSPPAALVLTPLARAVGRSAALGGLVWARPARAAEEEPVLPGRPVGAAPEEPVRERDLAA
ncbi:phosphatase PAP2 family protein [Streptomyces sp. NPDC058045]|uniref:phosphatase PAP2 family protein n=1 Tax=Streptomyces sp. NPDC058045 TaxID=3346311 RepID=UPI0036E64AAB